ERKERLRSGKPLQTIKRQLDQYELGMTRSQIAANLPNGAGVLTHDIQGGISITFTAEPTTSERTIVRQVFLLFDQSERLSEIRVRYVDGPAAGNKAAWAAGILATLKKQNGAPIEAPSSWKGLWNDSQARKSPAQSFVWNDDTSVLGYQCDQDGVELALA